MTIRPPSHHRPPALDPRLQEQIHTLWDNLAGYEAARIDDALLHLLEGVARLVDAQNAYWAGAVRLVEDERDPLLGWRPRLVRYLRPLPNDEKFTQQRLRSIQRGRADELTMAQARLAGRFRANRMCDLVAPAFFKSETYAGYRGRGVYDSLTVATPITPRAEAYYGFLRMRSDDPFTEAQRDIAFYAMRGLTWFHRQVLLAQGLLAADEPLSPVEHRVLALLLSDRPEKAIAAELGVTPATGHTYVKTVLRKLGVSGRNGLLALWLGRGE